MKAIIAATILGIIMMFASIMVKNKKSIVALATVLLFVLLGVNIYDMTVTPATEPHPFFNNMLRVDRFSLWFNTLMTACS
ncbi:MAG: hypothetical protein ACTHJ0_11330, partial [Flavipsychrobacter sp.]